MSVDYYGGTKGGVHSGGLAAEIDMSWVLTWEQPRVTNPFI